MNLCNVYKKLPNGERHKWYEDFRQYWLSNKKEHPSFSNLYSSDVQKIFSDYIDMNTTKSPQQLQHLARQFRKPVMYGIQTKVLVEMFLKHQYKYRYDWIETNCPEILI